MRRDAGRPIVGVTGPVSRRAPGRLAAMWRVRRAGGRAVWLAPGERVIPDDLHGLIVTGGSDIDPALYLTEGGPWTPVDPQRDQFELAALGFARDRALPVLGICRGAQLMNVFAGGTLHRDITDLRRVTSNRPTLLPSKAVEVDAATRLARALGRTQLRVNSLHHQAVHSVGDGLRIVARDGDGIVQGIEGADERWRVGVQWHPEYLGWRRPHRRLFGALVEAARARRHALLHA